jgi:competence protein ComGC
MIEVLISIVLIIIFVLPTIENLYKQKNKTAETKCPTQSTT